MERTRSRARRQTDNVSVPRLQSLAPVDGRPAFIIAAGESRSSGASIPSAAKLWKSPDTYGQDPVKASLAAEIAPGIKNADFAPYARGGVTLDNEAIDDSEIQKHNATEPFERQAMKVAGRRTIPMATGLRIAMREFGETERMS